MSRKNNLNPVTGAKGYPFQHLIIYFINIFFYGEYLPAVHAV